MKPSTLCSALLVCLGVLPLFAAGQDSGEDVTARMNRLESETDSLRAEVQWLREHPARLPAVEATPVSASMDMAAPSAAADGTTYTLPELQDEMKKLAWTKGDFKIVPYGFLWGNMVYATERTFPGSYTLFVQSATTQGENEFIVDVRNTRLGFDVLGPKIPFFNGAQSGGKVEIDFQQAVLSTENKPTILLRHAYWEVKNEEFRMLVGQTWDVISPVNPDMLLYTVGWDGGNIGYRRAQFRYERYLACSDVSLLTMQASANETVFEDTSAKLVGEFSNWPIVEMRVATTLGDRGPTGRPITFGVSGHIGEEQNDVFNAAVTPAVQTIHDVRRRTWSVNGDFRAPITDRFGFEAEVFTGENLGAFLGGIGQGIDVTTLNPIRSNGGWLEFWYDFTPTLHTHFGYSIDDPNDNDVTTTGERKYNSFYFGNVVYDITKTCLTGLEVSSWKTLFVNQLPGESVRFEYVLKYGF